MYEIIDKLILFLCCTSIYLFESAYSLWIIPMILALTISSLNSYIERPLFHGASFVFFCLLCSFWSGFLFFLPLVFYDVVSYKKHPICLFALVPILLRPEGLQPRILLLVLSFTALTVLLKLRTTTAQKLKEEYIKFRDRTSEVSTLLEEQNASLLENQDHEIHVATLRERNRIAREIHDSLGHILSRCLLQIGAMLATNKDPRAKETLNSIKTTLSQGMDSIRRSIHNLHDESIDLYEQIHGLVKGFSFCSIKLHYDISENPDRKLKYSLIAIVKEALSNIIKHSSASEVSIHLKEHPGFYQLVIQDNGTASNYNPDKGIGIKNIFDRVSAFHGNVNIHTDKGFKIFISIPKERSK